jgi:transcriptional regulator with XRE-family HTH domain
MLELAQRIKELRDDLGLPIAEFADLIAVSKSALYNYETGERLPNAEVLGDICKAAGVNPNWLLLGYGNKKMDPSTAKKLSAIAVLLGEDRVKKTAQKSIKTTKSSANAASETEGSVVQQTANGNNNVQAARDIVQNIKTQKLESKVTPPTGSIGSNPILVETITGLFNELGDRREKRFGKSAYPVMYNAFKKDFSIPKNQKYTTYKLWKESRAQEIIKYLQEKLDETITGRKQRTAKKKGHTRPYLLKQTSELHECLGWSEATYRGRLHFLFGVTSRRDLNVSQLKSYIEYLEDEYGKKY